MYGFVGRVVETSYDQYRLGLYFQVSSDIIITFYRSVSAWFEEQLAKSTFDGQTIRPTSWDVARNAPLMMYKPPYEMSINRLHRITQVAVNDSIRIYMYKKNTTTSKPSLLYPPWN